MLINNWYALAQAGELQDTPLEVAALGLKFVLFRDEAGQPCCLANVCCHRGGSLARGKVLGNCIACSYHGWQFNTSGTCIRIPMLDNQRKIPARARVPAYPVQEKYGLIWAFLGDTPQESRPELPDVFPEYAQQDTWHISAAVVDWQVSWQRFFENAMDTAHIWHAHSFASYLGEGVDISVSEDLPFYTRLSLAFHSDDGDAGRDSDVRMEQFVIGVVARNIQTMPGFGRQLIWYAICPVDEFSTRVFSYFGHEQPISREEHDLAVKLITGQVIGEDQYILNDQQPAITPPNLRREVWVESDEPEFLCRRKVADAGETLGVIDATALRTLLTREVRVIPSPNYSGGRECVHQAVPIIGRKYSVRN